jgi:cytoskeletal protein RodZ
VNHKPAAVLRIPPRSRLASHQAASTAARIAPAEFAEHLLRGREEKKRSLEDIADSTKISIHQLRALERGDLDRLPAGIYRRAIVRQYAAAVGLNVEVTIRELEDISAETDGNTQGLEMGARAGRDVGSSSLTTALWWSAAALLVLAGVAAIATAWYRASAAGPVAPAPVTGASAAAPVTEASAIARVAATDIVRPNGKDIELATEPTVSQPPTPAPAETTRVTADEATAGELRITSDPEGAFVTVNGVGWGPTPVTVRYLPFGKKLIRATKPGYVTMQRGLDLGPDRRVRSVRIQLSPEAPR